MAAMGRQLKQSVKVFHSLMLYRLLPAQEEMAHRKPAHHTNPGLAFCAALQGALWLL